MFIHLYSAFVPFAFMFLVFRYKLFGVPEGLLLIHRHVLGLSMPDYTQMNRKQLNVTYMVPAKIGKIRNIRVCLTVASDNNRLVY